MNYYNNIHHCNAIYHHRNYFKECVKKLNIQTNLDAVLSPITENTNT